MKKILLPNWLAAVVWALAALPANAAPQWSNVAVFSPFSTPEYNRLCYSDGSGLVCDANRNLIGESAFPSGSVVPFALSACPTGWTEYTALRGRFIRGIDLAGTTDPSGTRALGSIQEGAVQQHTHTVDPASTGSNTDTHSHTVDYASTATGDGSHTHSIPVMSGETGSTEGAHTHTYQGGVTANTTTGGAAARVNNLSGAGASGSTSLDGSTHTHTVSIAAGTAFGSESTHTHSADIPSASGSASGSHAHTADITATASAATGTGTDIRPLNVALLYCRKD